jgi:hypothetical protein
MRREDKQASVLYNEMKKLKYEMVRNEVNMINSVKWSWFKVPVKVKQIIVILFSDTSESNCQIT